MWVMQISIPGKKTTLLGNLAKKYKIRVVGYPVSHEIKKDCVKVITSGMFIGKNENLKKFYKETLSDKRTLKLELKNNFGISYMKQDLHNRFLYQPGVFFVKPGIITEKGEYIFELAAWDKTKLMKIIKAYTNKNFSGKLHWIKQKKISNVQVLSVFPNLTEKQWNCFQIAVENDYYGYPRKSDLKTLAKIAGISYSTYQFHLRVAEKKIMPFLKDYIGICR